MTNYSNTKTGANKIIQDQIYLVSVKYYMIALLSKLFNDNWNGLVQSMLLTGLEDSFLENQHSEGHLRSVTVFNLGNFKGGHFHLISDKNKKNCQIFPH